MPMTQADNLRASLHDLKRTLQNAARLAATSFEEQTGLAVRSIEIDFQRVDVSPHGDDWPSFVSTQPTARVWLFDIES